MAYREEILSRLSGARNELEALGVRRLRIFGSAARGEAVSDSDVDLLIDFDERPVGLFELNRIKARIREILGVERVDIVTSEGLHPALRERVLAEAIDAA
jgi:hypothetical protein